MVYSRIEKYYHSSPQIAPTVTCYEFMNYLCTSNKVVSQTFLGVEKTDFLEHVSSKNGTPANLFTVYTAKLIYQEGLSHLSMFSCVTQNK